ncbi:hypothetical protein [Gloeocapsa sp. PCC 73106]|uniref:hypothetical protein n=1 Tax=Gloeocapsa sp. PCC 73106 TaxID=102232 RepID=UPI0002AC9FEA|nr:hypothetical protein [Gloeocapsa sp. PCC 73106]ELR97392.1 hypothetical protein GLO73106DRAFT_00012010 [Gloeocapsa sp. PCC 73106]
MLRITSFVIYLIIGFSFVLLLGQTAQIRAQTLRPEEVAPQVYQLLPDFPQENHYIRSETNEPDASNTLVNRLVTYHQFTKRRPTAFRLDWKLTLADYLGVNEKIFLESYPGYNTLTVNPLPGDLQAIQALNLRQRNQLVEVLMNIYQPPSEAVPTPTPTPSPTSVPSLPLPKPGDAELLRP